MNRRQLIRNLFITGSVIWLFPECMSGPGGGDHDFLDEAQQNLLEDIAETIIPSTNTPGAKTLGLHHFINKMMTDCRSPANRKAFTAGLEKFPGFVKQQTGKSWAESAAGERQQVLNDIIADGNGDKAIQACINTIRGLAVTGYKNSEYYLTNIQKYQLIPGHFYGCVEINNRGI